MAKDNAPAAPWNTPFFKEVIKLYGWENTLLTLPEEQKLIMAYNVCVNNTTPMLYSNATTQVALWSIFVMQWPAITLYALFGLDETGSIPK